MKNIKKGDIVNVRVDKDGHFKEIHNAIVKEVYNYSNFTELHIVRCDNTTIEGNMGFMGVDGRYNIDLVSLSNNNIQYCYKDRKEVKTMVCKCPGICRD